MEFRLLGPLEARKGGRSLPLGGPKQRGLLALLLLEAGRVVSTDRLIEELWGPQAPRTVDASIQNCVSRLRGTLGREVIETRSPGYVLHVDAARIDAVRFERALDAAMSLDPPERVAALSEVLALWRGPALADVTFEGLARTEVARLEELRVTALELRLESELALGRHRGILGELEALAARYPTRERLRCLQMLALYRAGRQRDALRVYQETRLALVEELGLEPGEELRALERMIIAQDPSLALRGRPVDEEDDASGRATVVLLAAFDVVGEPTSDRVRELLAAALTELELAVQRHGGSLVGNDPAHASAEFGVPAVHDDDVARALRAAVEARTALPSAVSAIFAVERKAAGHGDACEQLLSVGAPGELLLGPAGLRLVPSAVDVVPHASGAGYRVLRFDPQAEPFARHLETPLVGRRVELQSLEAALAEIAESRSPKRLVVVGEAGIGKTRLLRELVARVRGNASVLVGRCAAYGEASAALPVIEILQQIGPLTTALTGEPDADRIAEQLQRRVIFDNDGFWAMRRVLETVARRAPLLIVLEDAHLATPNLLDLVDYLVGWTDAPLLVVCAARPALLDARPEWREDALFLGRLSPAESEQLADGLPERPGLDAATIDHAVAAAEGNPLFLEQFIASGREEGGVPPTVEVLIASRLDALPRDERAVLERASVAGRVFWRAAVEHATPPDERDRVGPALMSLTRRRLVRPTRSTLVGEDGFRFHHGLIRDVVYGAITPPVRASLHESVARSLDGREPRFDAIVGYHLEQAALLHATAGEPQPALTVEAGRRLGAAGMQALLRVDGRAATSLLHRATSLLPDDADRLELEWGLATALKFSGDPVAEDRLQAVREKAARHGAATIGLRARIEQCWPRLSRGASTADEELAFLEGARPVLDAADDTLGLARAWHATAAVVSTYRFDFAEVESAALNARANYRRCGFAPGVVTTLLAGCLYRGPTPALVGIDRCTALLAEAETPVWQSFVLPFLAVLEAMDGRAEQAAAHLEEALVRRREFADTGTVATSWAALAAEVELLVGEPGKAEAILVESIDVLRGGNDAGWLATNTAYLGEARYRLRRFDEALADAESALAVSPRGYLTATTVADRVKAKALARAGLLDDATRLARASVEALASTDAIDAHAETLLALAEVLALQGNEVEALVRLDEACESFAQKGNTAAAGRAREACRG